MIITKQQQEKIVNKYVEEKHSTDECIGFIDGINATIELINKLTIPVVSERFDFDKLLQDYRIEFVNGGGYVKSDTFEDWVEPYHVFEWFKKKLS